MMVVPVKWIPYLLVIAGIFGLASGEESIGLSIGMAAVGGVWLYFKHSGKRVKA
ncbi:MAG: hypothetical protein IKJ65_12530 [Clostridia bacterium]|nr:hypothetical protein [Clostridia bacterium]